MTDITVDVTPQLIDIDVSPVVVDVTIIDPNSVGPAGPPGPPGDGQLFAATADVILGGHRVVIATPTGVNYADNTNTQHAFRVVGITEGAVLVGEQASVRVFGEMIEPSWNWSIGPVWLGSNGMLTQTPPASPAVFSLIIGEALSSTMIFINPSLPVFL